MRYFIAAIVFISMAIVLIFSPSQLFSRHDPVMIRLIMEKNSYKRILKYFGYVFLIAGIYFVCSGLYNL
jgi:hypothetical protein